jgi:predicted SprT family Zn-dependent metalloprotease
MKIPKEIKIGGVKHTIEQPKGLNLDGEGCRGAYFEDRALIYVAKGTDNPENWQKFTEKERSETFWHEIVHAILHDMKHRQRDDEKFVIGFSQRLNDAIRSAKF